MPLQHSKRCMHDSRGWTEPQTDLYDASAPFVRRRDDLGCTLKRLCPFIEKPLPKMRRPLKMTYPQTTTTRPMIPNAPRVAPKQIVLRQLEAQVASQKRLEMSTPWCSEERADQEPVGWQYHCLLYAWPIDLQCLDVLHLLLVCYRLWSVPKYGRTLPVESCAFWPM